MASEVVVQEESLLPMLFEDIHESGRIEKHAGPFIPGASNDQGIERAHLRSAASESF